MCSCAEGVQRLSARIKESELLGKEVTTADMVILGLEAIDKADATRQLANRLVAAGRVTNIETFLEAVAKREEHFPTGIEGGIAIPHAQSASVTIPSVAIATSVAGVDFGAEDGKSNLIFLIAAPENGGSEHLEILGTIAYKVMDEDFRNELLAETDPAVIAATLTREVQK
jgi:fructose-specific phosphotransferase system IIA component